MEEYHHAYTQLSKLRLMLAEFIDRLPNHIDCSPMFTTVSKFTTIFANQAVMFAQMDINIVEPEIRLVNGFLRQCSIQFESIQFNKALLYLLLVVGYVSIFAQVTHAVTLARNADE